MRDPDWRLLLARIEDGLCTPFLGAGAVVPALPLGADIARRWAAEHEYPLDDADDLARVAQYLSVYQDDAMYPKDLICDELAHAQTPDFGADGEIHSVLAALPLPRFPCPSS
jgi:hypothetical protein